MGIYRFFLAIAILIGHANNGTYFPQDVFPYVRAAGFYGAAKVHCFFLISGFFSDMLINERLKNAKNYISDFYVSRLIRLLPGYYFVLLLTVWFVYIGPYFGLPQAKPKLVSLDYVANSYNQVGGVMYYILNLIPLVPETLRMSDFAHHKPVLFLLVGQAWSLSIEYACLLLTPFVLRRKWLYAVALPVSLYITITLAHQGIYDRYILTTVSYFLAGSLAFRAYKRWFAQLRPTIALKVAHITVMTILISYLFSFGYVGSQIGMGCAYTIFMLMSFLSLPLLFAGSRTFIKDQWLGDMAYPIYLNHGLVMWVLWSYQIQPPVMLWVLPILSVAMAYGMARGIDKPLQRWRQKHYYQPLKPALKS